jgi:hypothetical protein
MISKRESNGSTLPVPVTQTVQTELHTVIPCIRIKRGMEGKTGDGSTSTQTLFRKESEEGAFSKRARAHCHTQAWARYRD